MQIYNNKILDSLPPPWTNFKPNKWTKACIHLRPWDTTCQTTWCNLKMITTWWSTKAKPMVKWMLPRPQTNAAVLRTAFFTTISTKIRCRSPFSHSLTTATSPPPTRKQICTKDGFRWATVAPPLDSRGPLTPQIDWWIQGLIRGMTKATIPTFTPTRAHRTVNRRYWPQHRAEAATRAW